MNVLLRCAILATAFATATCGENRQAQQKGTAQATPAKIEADKQLLADPAHAGPEIERRLRAQLKVTDGLLIVRNPASGFATYILPANSSWVVSCGLSGITIDFGNAVSPDEPGNVAHLDLALGAGVSSKVCDEVGPMVGKTLQSILAGK